MTTSTCELNEIFLGEIASIQNYGAFVRIPGCKQQGLIHKSQVSSSRVDDVADVLQRGERVWCKVINIEDDGKVGLSMKHVNQGNGKDLDPNGAEQQRDQQRRKKMVPGRKKAIELEAIFDTTCSKCGTRGHLAKDCFVTPDGKKYDLVPEETVEPPPPDLTSVTKEEKSTSPKKPKKKKKKLRHRSDGITDDDSDDDDDDDDDENQDNEFGQRKRKKRKKKKSKESSRSKRKKRKRKHSESRSDSDSSDSTDNREAKGRRESNDKKSKKCKHSRSKHSD